MSSVREHYATYLGPVYSWMMGGVESALEKGSSEIEAICGSFPGKGALAIDLGSGFGAHAIPLARRGFSVLAVDSCSELLRELQLLKGSLPIRTVEDDLLSFPRHLITEVDFILCMGDTLTHLPDFDSVRRLIATTSKVLRPGGWFVLTFRDYSHELIGEQRFIPVRSDDTRILTCFLEYTDSHVTVHDILHEREQSGWAFRMGSYRKLRLAPDRVIEALESSGFSVRREPGMAGMVRLVTKRI